MSKTTLTHFFGCVCAVICAVMSFFAFVTLKASLADYIARPDPTEGSLLSYLHPSSLLFGVIAVATFGMTISAFADKIFAAVQSPVFHPVFRLLGVTPTTPPGAVRASSRRTSFFYLNSWQIGGILAVLLFFAGLSWYYWPWLAGKIFESYSHQLNDAISQPSR